MVYFLCGFKQSQDNHKVWQKYFNKICYETENYVGKTFLNPKLCKNLVALLIACHTRTETKTRGIFCKKSFLFENLDI